MNEDFLKTVEEKCQLIGRMKLIGEIQDFLLTIEEPIQPKILDYIRKLANEKHT